MSELILGDESYQVVGACFEVYNEMGCGFLESVYQECLGYELTDRAIPFTEKTNLPLQFKKRKLQKRFEADFICFGQIVVEIKSSSGLIDEHSAQLLNYLHATKYPLGLLINFGSYPKLQYKRIALTQRVE
jgi:GxxExxY protein